MLQWISFPFSIRRFLTLTKNRRERGCKNVVSQRIILTTIVFFFISQNICHSRTLSDDSVSIDTVTSKTVVLGPFVSDNEPVYHEHIRYGIKSNVLPWIATIPNIGGEVRFKGHFSASLDLWFCPWKISDRYSLKTVAILPECRYWLSRQWKGHHFDLHVTAAWFNLRYKNDRYQDTDRPLVGCGISYGYLFNIDDNWSFDLYVGAGFMSMKYDTFYNIPNGALIDTRRTNYFGIDRLGISFSYIINP